MENLNFLCNHKLLFLSHCAIMTSIMLYLRVKILANLMWPTGQQPTKGINCSQDAPQKTLKDPIEDPFLEDPYEDEDEDGASTLLILFGSSSSISFKGSSPVWSQGVRERHIISLFWLLLFIRCCGQKKRRSRKRYLLFMVLQET